jgi:integrase
MYGRYKKFLHDIGKAKPLKSRFLKLKAPKLTPKTVTLDQVKQLIDACAHIRDKFLISLLYETGMRIGQALGLRHEDIHSRECVIYVVPRDNANGARAKTKEPYPIHVSANLMRLYAEYLADEVQDNITDYVFINLWRRPIGKPITIGGVEDLFRRISNKSGIQIHPHMLRHTHATELIRNGWDPSYVQRRLGHSSIQTTINTYVHLSDDDLKKAYQEYQTKKERKP